MRRREFASLLGGAVVAWPLAARAQQAGQMRRVGVLMNNSPFNQVYQSYLTTFTRALQTLGWKDGQNLHLDIRWSDNNPDQLQSLAGELAKASPEIMVAASTANLKALMRTTQTVPIVFIEVSDPVAQGLVTNLAHPGSNITGFAAYELSMGGKWLDLLRQMAPNLTRVGVMSNPDTSPQSIMFRRSIEMAASSFGVTSIAMPVHGDADIESTIEGFAAESNGGLLVPTDSFMATRAKTVVDAAARYRLPAIYAEEDVFRSGGLMYYGISFDNQFRQLAVYVDRILKGAKPGDLPVEMPTTFKLVISLKVAKALGIDVATGLMLRADELIE
jgi:putative ABC transport system substrate-binding protein